MGEQKVIIFCKHNMHLTWAGRSLSYKTAEIGIPVHVLLLQSHLYLLQPGQYLPQPLLPFVSWGSMLGSHWCFHWHCPCFCAIDTVLGVLEVATQSYYLSQPCSLSYYLCLWNLARTLLLALSPPPPWFCSSIHSWTCDLWSFLGLALHAPESFWSHFTSHGSV